MGQSGGLVNFESSINAFSNDLYKFSISCQLIFTVNNYLQHELAGITLDQVLKNLLMDSSQIIKILRTKGFMSSTRNYVGSLPGNTRVAAPDRGRRNDSCRTETPAMHRGKLVPSRHRQKGNFFEKPCFNHWFCSRQCYSDLSKPQGTDLPAHMVTTEHTLL